jgi:hypothetical protein
MSIMRRHDRTRGDYAPRQSSSESATSSRWEDAEVTAGRRDAGEGELDVGIVTSWGITIVAHRRGRVDHPSG